MSYCRWGSDSDFYIYRSVGGICIHGPGDDMVKLTEQEALNFLQKQIKAGKRVPKDAINRLKREIAAL